MRITQYLFVALAILVISFFVMTKIQKAISGSYDRTAGQIRMAGR